MLFMNNIFTWLNGKKTTIGAILLFAAVFCGEVIVGIWHYNPDWMPKLIETLNWVGMPLTGAGLIHKGIKK